jgi:membrane protease YdiL (CAAX protease family)
VIAARPAPAQRALMLVVAVGTAVVLRSITGGAAPAASAPAAAVFAAVLAAAALWGGTRLTRISWHGAALGVAGAAALVALATVGEPAVLFGARAPVSSLLWWMPLVSVVAAAEELLLRGVLFDAIRAHGGDALAVAMTALLFALIHLPLYGAPALGVDLCVGVFLGCLRVASGGLTAPLVAHVLADLATGWVG